ncbi:hypothetical protein CspeluHIS016_0702130 [Cutaneotrichosporon spelunceum]|uniref:Uncharacterized protein n=1 Tax=Cutaneotrichosporon spelunceum TaxID=1672016 RepID=A0AAD3YEK3_9TREE|nr:hypothetical protein CspeluHIS016_0702130 [Cutaneotrichosporon spelunceum]
MAYPEYVPTPTLPHTSDKADGFEVVSPRTVEHTPEVVSAPTVEQTPDEGVEADLDQAADDLAAVSLVGAPEPASRTVTVVVVGHRKHYGHGSRKGKQHGVSYPPASLGLEHHVPPPFGRDARRACGRRNWPGFQRGRFHRPQHDNYTVDIELPAGIDPADVDWDATLREMRHDERQRQRRKDASGSTSGSTSDTDSSSSESDSTSDSDSEDCCHRYGHVEFCGKFESPRHCGFGHDGEPGFGGFGGFGGSGLSGFGGCGGPGGFGRPPLFRVGPHGGPHGHGPRFGGLRGRGFGRPCHDDPHGRCLNPGHHCPSGHGHPGPHRHPGPRPRHCNCHRRKHAKHPKRRKHSKHRHNRGPCSPAHGY